MNGAAIMNTRYRIAVLLPLFTFFTIIFYLTGIPALAADTQSSAGEPANDGGPMDLFVICEWDDAQDQDRIRPDRVSVSLYENGNETGREITLSKENGWSGSFDRLPCVRNGEILSYSIIEARVEGYTGTIEGSDRTGYRIVNIHEPLPEGKSGQAERKPGQIASGEKEEIVETVITKKVFVSRPARTSTSTRKSGSAKTSDTSEPSLWELMALVSFAGVFLTSFLSIRMKRG